MENLLLLLAGTYVLGRPVKRSGRQSIGATGCSIHFTAPAVFERSLTAGGDTLFVTEILHQRQAFGAICIQLAQADTYLEEAETLLRHYIGKLRGPFGILHDAGFESGSLFDRAVGIASVSDYWQDGWGKDWKVKGYTNGQVLAVLYVRNIGAGDATREDAFLDSFCFR